MAPRPIILTKHAKKRRVEMGISIDTALQIVADPDVIYDQTYDGKPTQVYKRGDLTAVCTRDSGAAALTVITFVYKATDADKRWNRDEEVAKRKAITGGRWI